MVSPQVALAQEALASDPIPLELKFFVLVSQ
jgi:hypothetical protein